MRPWKATPEEEDRDGVYCDYSAYERWFVETIDETLPDYADLIWDNMTTTQQLHLYVKLAQEFDKVHPAAPGGTERSGMSSNRSL